MIKMIPASLALAFCMQSSLTLAEQSAPQGELAPYTYNSISFGLALDATGEADVTDKKVSSSAEGDGFVLSASFEKQLDDKLFILGELDIGDYEEKIRSTGFEFTEDGFEEITTTTKTDISKTRFGVGIGYHRPLADGEASLNLGIKLLNLKDELKSGGDSIDESNTGYGLFVGMRHIWSNDILDLDLDGTWEGQYTLERHKIDDNKTVFMKVGLSYHFDKQLSAGAKVILGDEMYGDFTLDPSEFFKQLSLGITYGF